MKRRTFLAGVSASALATQAKAQVNQLGAAPLLFAGPQVLPGYIGYWKMDQYTTSPRKVVPNAASTTPVSGNLFNASRRMFNNGEIWHLAGVTAVDNAVVGPDGLSQASTFSGTGNWFMNISGNVPNATTHLPAGTYTIAINAKRNTGSDQQFAFSQDNTATRSPFFTATSSWQRFAWTFTADGSHQMNVLLLCSIDGSTAANIQICDYELYAGSSDLGPESYAGHLKIGGCPTDASANFSSGFLDMSTAGAAGLVQFTNNQTIANFTVHATVKKVGSGGGAYFGILSSVTTYTSFTAATEVSQFPFATFSTDGTERFNQLAAGLWNLLSVGVHVITQKYDGTNFELWLDDARVYVDNNPSLVSVAYSDFWFNAVNNPYSGSLTGGNSWQSVVLYNTALTAAQIRGNVALLQAAAAKYTTLPTDRILFAMGDSITGAFSYSYPYQATYSPAIIGTDWGISGYGLSDLNSQASTVDAGLPPSLNGRKFILSVLIGANDLGSYSGGNTQFAADLASYCDARRAAGWKVVLCTLLPQTTAGFNTKRDAVNTIIYGWSAGQHYDALADFAADPTMGIDGNGVNTGPWNTTYYADGLHPTSAGMAILAGIYQTAVNSL